MTFIRFLIPLLLFLLAGPLAGQTPAAASQGEHGGAFGAFMKSLAASGVGNDAAALQWAERSVVADPDLLGARVRWAGLLLNAGRYQTAETVATQGISRRDNAALRVLRAVARQAQGRLPAAQADFDRALQMPGPSSVEARNYRLIAIDAALAARDPSRAQGLLHGLAGLSDLVVIARQRAVASADQPAITPAALPDRTLRPPLLRCYGSAGSVACELWPGADAPDPALATAQEAYRALADGDGARAAQLAERAVVLNPVHRSYFLLYLNALAASDQREQALAAAAHYLDAQPDAAEVWAFRSRMHAEQDELGLAADDARAALAAGELSLDSEVDMLLRLGRHADASARFARAMMSPELRASADPDLAYIAVRVGDDATALTVFNRAAQQARLPASALQDAAYAASRTGDDRQSVAYFRRSIDAADAGRLPLSDQQRFATRREIAERSRRWGINALLGYRGVTPGAAMAPAAFGDVAQLVGEVYWRPSGYGGGRFWELYGSLAETVYNRLGSGTGASTLQGALGVRAKPLRDHNLMLSFERRVKLGSLARNDWLLRVGYSGSHGTDLRLDVPTWSTVNLYAEAGHFLRARQSYATLELQAGRSIRIGGTGARSVLFPHLVFGADHNSVRTAAGHKGAAGVGAGISLRHWFRESHYQAPRSHLDLSLQYRIRVAGDERGQGVFLRATLNY